MDYEETITKILGDHTEEQGRVASLVLSYVTENPDWRVKEHILYKDKVLRAMDIAVTRTFGNPLEHYLCRCRKRELVEVRYMVFLLFREETEASFTEIGNIFKMNHSTVVFGVKTAKDLIKLCRPFREDYQTLKNCYLSVL